MSPGWVRTQVRTHSDFCWTRGLGLGLWPTGLGLGLGLWSSGLGLGLGLWLNGLGLTPDGLGLWSYGLGLGLGLWPCGLGLTAGLTSPDSLQHCNQVTWSTFRQILRHLLVNVRYWCASTVLDILRISVYGKSDVDPYFNHFSYHWVFRKTWQDVLLPEGGATYIKYCEQSTEVSCDLQFSEQLWNVTRPFSQNAYTATEDLDKFFP